MLHLPPCITTPEQLLSPTRADEYFGLLSPTTTLASMHHGYGAKLPLQLLELLDNYFDYRCCCNYFDCRYNYFVGAP